MTSLVWFTRRAPSPLAAAVAAHGHHRIYEAIAVSEVLALMEQHSMRILIIDSTVDDGAARELQGRFITLRLQPQATTAQILWELSGIAVDPHLRAGTQ